MAGFVTHIDDIDRIVDGDVVTRTTIDESVGAERLTQRVVDIPPSAEAARLDTERDEVAYVVTGTGTVSVDGVAFDIKSDVGVYLRAGESASYANGGEDVMTLVVVTAPPEIGATGHQRKVVVDTARQPVIPAGKDRQFKFVVDPKAGCAEVTQFVGWIPPGRAPTHYHLYDEVMFILDGEGVLHLEGHPDTPIRAGTCIHLPPPTEHCVENTGDRPLRVLGVFHPAGSAAEAYEDTSDNQ